MATSRTQGDARAERALKEVAHAVEQRGNIDRGRVEVLLARKGEHALGQRRAAFGALHRCVDQPLRARIVRQLLAQQIEISDHRHQEIVEVVSDTAGELAEALHLLRLKELLLSLLACGNLRLERRRALTHAVLEGLGQVRKRLALVRQLPQQPLALDLRGFARCNVRGDADQALDRAEWILDRSRPHVDPMNRSVGPDHAMLDGVVLSRREAVRHCVAHVCDVGGMDRFAELIVGK